MEQTELTCRFDQEHSEHVHVVLVAHIDSCLVGVGSKYIVYSTRKDKASSSRVFFF